MYRRGSVHAKRIRCASNLKQIGLAIKPYADAHGARLPDDFGVLLMESDLSADVFICPASETDEERATGDTPDAVAKQLMQPGHCSYVYLGKGLVWPVESRRVLAVDLPDNHQGDGVNVLWGDCATEWVDGPKATELLLSIGFRRVDEQGR
jgi:hypothetical protein